MPGDAARILITGANGHIGRQLVDRLGSDDGRWAGHERPLVRALVRSDRAADTLRAQALVHPPEIVIADYTDPAAMRSAAHDCRYVVHLVGIIKEGRGARYVDAHEETCRVLERAAADGGAQRIVYLSIFGSNPDSSNACLASKGRAEQILLKGTVPTTVLRVPMVIGPEDFSSAALRREARSRIVVLTGGGATMQQPIDSHDVLSATLAALSQPSREMIALDIGGPERLTQRALILRAGALYGRRPLVLPIPVAIARGFARLFERLLADPPITPAMLEILQHDDRIDEAATCDRLKIELTPLDETLRRYVGPESLQG
jgi:NADH dehydrogenase